MNFHLGVFFVVALSAIAGAVGSPETCQQESQEGAIAGDSLLVVRKSTKKADGVEELVGEFTEDKDEEKNNEEKEEKEEKEEEKEDEKKEEEEQEEEEEKEDDKDDKAIGNDAPTRTSAPTGACGLRIFTGLAPDATFEDATARFVEQCHSPVTGHHSLALCKAVAGDLFKGYKLIDLFREKKGSPFCKIMEDIVKTHWEWYDNEEYTVSDEIKSSMLSSMLDRQAVGHGEHDGPPSALDSSAWDKKIVGGSVKPIRYADLGGGHGMPWKLHPSDGTAPPDWEDW